MLSELGCISAAALPTQPILPACAPSSLAFFYYLDTADASKYFYTGSGLWADSMWQSTISCCGFCKHCYQEISGINRHGMKNCLHGYLGSCLQKGRQMRLQKRNVILKNISPRGVIPVCFKAAVYAFAVFLHVFL